VSVDPEIRISLRDFDQSIEKAYRTLFADDPDKTARLLSWRSRSPHGPPRFVVATQGSNVAGMIALVPARFCNAPGEGLGYQAIDTAVHPSFRGRGLFVEMGALAQGPALGADFLWGFPNANASPGWFGRLGWTNFGPVPLLVRPLRSSFLLERVHPRLRVFDLPLIRKSRRTLAAYENPELLSADFEGLWRRVSAIYGIAVDRRGDWMRWRLIDKPGADYRCVGVTGAGGELDAFVAVKVADKHGGRLCYVMEAISTPEGTDELGRILLAELGLAAQRGSEIALAWCPRSAPNYVAYRKAGFVPVPARMRPIEINFGARALSEEVAAAAASGANWYVSFLDSDTN
jgi:GNAT superfamily N-acetyltransferase